MLIFVLYDGINNSVFQGQVLQPLLKKLESGAADRVLIISLEKVQPSPEVCAAINAAHPNLSLIICKKYPFMGKLSLLPAISSLKKILNQQLAYNLMARGPLAGFVCTRAVDWKRCSSLTVQARGLLTQEYQYVTKDECNALRRVIHRLRTKLFMSLEIAAYADKKIIIEAVSPALKDYLVTQFGAHAQNIIIATHDLPPTFSSATVANWRQEIRTKLDIPTGAYVYCFNGSAKPWQCAPETIQFFEQRYAEDKNSFLLILSHDKAAFQSLLAHRNLPQSSYAILGVPHQEMFRYLSACDAGLIFREPSPVNWVSRPTKVLEYRAVGLEVIHNNTVAWLVK